MSLAIGIDLGTVYSCVAIRYNKNVEIFANSQGHFLTPSVVAFTNGAVIVGDAAKNQISENPENTIYGNIILSAEKTKAN